MGEGVEGCEEKRFHFNAFRIYSVQYLMLSETIFVAASDIANLNNSSGDINFIFSVDCKCKLNKIYQATISVEYTLSRKVSNSSSGL